MLHDGKLIFSGSTDEKIIAWDTSELRKRVRTFLGRPSRIVFILLYLVVSVVSSNFFVSRAVHYVFVLVNY